MITTDNHKNKKQNFKRFEMFQFLDTTIIAQIHSDFIHSIQSSDIAKGQIKYIWRELELINVTDIVANYGSTGLENEEEIVVGNLKMKNKSTSHVFCGHCDGYAFRDRCVSAYTLAFKPVL